MPTLYLTRGLPASGKTTRAKQMVEQSQGGLKRINRDDLREMLDNGHHSKGNENIVRQLQREMISSCLKAGRDVIVDDTNLVENTYSDLVTLGMELGADIETISFLDVPVQLCIERDKHRIKSVGEEVIRRMNKLIPRKSRPVPARRAVDPTLPWCIICDIDGTIAHMGDRRGPFDWKRVGVDEPDAEMRVLLSCLIAHQEEPPKLFYFSGRDSVCRAETLQWLKEHNFPRDPRTEPLGNSNLDYTLVMRPENDSRSDAIVKREMFEAHIEGKYNVLCVLDDRPRVIRMWRELGLLVLQVNDEEF